MKRYVTGLNTAGRSDLLAASEPPRVWSFEASKSLAPHEVVRELGRWTLDTVEPGGAAGAELWTVKTTRDAVVQEDPGDDTGPAGIHSLEVPAGLVRWAVTRWGPGYESKMHFTESIDLDCLIEGDLELVLEDASIHLEPGDVVIVPGLKHFWRTKNGATMLYTMISPFPLG
jgi:hypothetical protein